MLVDLKQNTPWCCYLFVVGGLRIPVILMAWLAGTDAEAEVPGRVTQARKADGEGSDECSTVACVRP